jgi:hypothetical protein
VGILSNKHSLCIELSQNGETNTYHHNNEEQKRKKNGMNVEIYTQNPNNSLRD